MVSLVRYGISVYGSSGATTQTKVQKILNFCARVVTGKKKFDHISDSFHQLRWLNAEELTDYHRLCIVHQMLTTGKPEQLAITLGQAACQRHSHDTRQAAAITLPRINSEAGRKRLNYSGVKCYNELPHVPTTNFRQQLKKRILSTRTPD